MLKQLIRTEANAVLVKTITFIDSENQEVVLRAGTPLSVDFSDMSFMWAGEYIDIQPDEVRPIN
jgi:hypothetical protein